MRFYTDVSQKGNTIFLRGWENGRRVQRKIQYKPYLFVRSQTETEYTSLFGDSLGKLDFENMWEAREFMKRYKDTSNMEIFGLDKFIYPFINDYYRGTIDYDPDQINVGTLDIEVSAEGGFPDIQRADKEVTAITIKKRDTIIVLGMKEYNSPDGVLYIKCKDEATLLSRFIDIWNQFDLDIVTGWNIEFFDIPYLVNRITQVLGEDFAKKLSPWNMLDEHNIEIMGRNNQVFYPRGVAILDYLQLYKKFTYTNQESYKLDHIAWVELGERKLDYSEYDGLHDMYVRDFQKYIDYNIHDVILVDRLDEKMKLISLALTVAYDAKINYSDVFTSVRLWDTIIHNHLMDNKVAISNNKVTRKLDVFAGAFVKDPLIGFHEDVVSFDVESLYPSLIVQFNISPETYRGKIDDYFTVDDLLAGKFNRQEWLRENNLAMTANGCLWDRSKKGVFPQLIEKMMAERKSYKKQMLEAQKEYQSNPSKEVANQIAKFNNLQMARKIQLNSLYGALGNQYFRWFDIDFAEAITLSGQLAIRWIEKNINAFMDKAIGKPKDRVIAIDTDSVYLNLSDLTNTLIGADLNKDRVDFIDKMCAEVFEPKIKKYFEQFAEYMNAYTPFLKMKREAIANKGIWTAKKRYILNVFDNEGVRYAEPKLKVMGIEAVKSSTPASCREKFKEAFKIIMTKSEDDVIDFIDTFREEFRNLPFDDVAFPRSCNGLSDYSDRTTIYKKGTPIHVRGALVYNHYLKEHQLDNKLETIKEGEKIKFCYMKTPNPIRENVISVNNGLPKVLNMDKYIDYELQFNKAFLEPLKTILDKIGYDTERRATLADFFS